MWRSHHEVWFIPFKWYFKRAMTIRSVNIPFLRNKQLAKWKTKLVRNEWMQKHSERTRALVIPESSPSQILILCTVPVILAQQYLVLSQKLIRNREAKSRRVSLPWSASPDSTATRIMTRTVETCQDLHPTCWEVSEPAGTASKPLRSTAVRHAAVSAVIMDGRGRWCNFTRRIETDRR